MSDAIASKLSSLFDANRTARRLHDELAEGGPAPLLEVLERTLKQVEGEDNEDEASLRLSAIAGLLAEIEGPKAVDLLINVLDSELPEARAVAGERLEEVAFDRFKEVAKGIERALQRLPAGSPALPELPYILAEIPEPGVTKLLAQFLKHEDAEAVASAIQVIAEAGDPAGAELIRPLCGDTRLVDLGDEDSDDEESEVTLGELAEEALEMLGSEAEDGGQEA